MKKFISQLIKTALPAFIVMLAQLQTTHVYAQAIIDKTLVIVNQEAVTLSEYRVRHLQEVLQRPTRYSPYSGVIDRRILSLMIDDRIQVQLAARRGINISPAEVDRSIGFIAQQNEMSPDALLEKLVDDGITEAEFRAGIREQQMIKRLVDSVVNSRVTVSEEEVQNYLARNDEAVKSDEEFEVSHLFIALAGKSEIQAESDVENMQFIRAEIIDGKPFDTAAREFSDGPQSGEGGYLGWRNTDQLPKLFVDALRQTEVDSVSEIIRSNNGLHLLKLHSHRGGQTAEQQLIRHILIRPDPQREAEAADEEAVSLANDLYARIQDGEDFTSIARTHSDDRVSGLEGGVLGWLNPGTFPPEIENTLSQLPVKILSRPIRAPAGYHLFEVLDRRRIDIGTEVANQRARRAIFQRKAANFYDNWFGAIRDAVHIEYVAAELR